MTSIRTAWIVLLLSMAFAVIAQAFGYGILFALYTLAKQVPLLAVLFFFGRDAKRIGKKNIFVYTSLASALLFLASGLEELGLVRRFGVLHASDSGLAEIGISVVSIALLVGAATGWAVLRFFRRTHINETA